MRIIQISDPHIVAPLRDASALVSGRLDTPALLQQAVARIAEVLPKVGRVDALLITGDVTDDGEPASYAECRRILAPLDLPILAIPGNHDARGPMRTAFADTGVMPATGPLDWVRDLPGLRVVGLDTLVEGQGGGTLGEDTLGFLDTALASAPDGPILVALHHPPFACGIRFMDAIGLSNSGALAEVLRRSEREVRLVCGHIHHVQIGTVGGCTALSAPSICSTFDVDFSTDAGAGFLSSPGGFLLHDWTDGLRTVEIPPIAGAGPFPF